MQPNITDLQTHLSILIPDTHQECVSKSRPTIKKRSNTKPHAPCYEISSKRVMKLFPTPHSVSSYEFSKVDETSDQQPMKHVQKMVFAPSSIQKPLLPECKIVLCHNYESHQSYELILQLGKKLISGGVLFQISFSHKNMSGDVSPSLSASISPDSVTHVNKHITFLSELKQTISLVKKELFEFDSIWIISGALLIGVYNVCGFSGVPKILRRVETDYLHLHDAGLVERKLIPQSNKLNFSLLLSTVMDAPTLQTLKRSQKVLDSSIALKESILSCAQQSKQKIYSFRKQTDAYEDSRYFSREYTNQESQSLEAFVQEDFNRNQHHQMRSSSNPYLKQSSTQPILSLNSTQPRKVLRKQNAIVDFETNKENTLYTEKQWKRKQRRHKKQKRSQSSSSSSASPKKSMKEPAKSDMTTVLAENMNLKWQLKTLQHEFDQQAKQYIKKMNLKIEGMTDDRSTCLQENAKLRRDNQGLLEQINQIKAQYDGIIMTRASYQEQIKKQNLAHETKIQTTYSNLLASLEAELRQFKGQNETLKKELNNLKSALLDSRARTSQKLKSLTEEMNGYKSMCQELRELCQSQQRQLRVEKNRSQNLQKRCRKYRDSMDDLLKLQEDGHQGNYKETARRNETFGKQHESESSDKPEMLMSFSKAPPIKDRHKQRSSKRKNESGTNIKIK